MMGEQEAFRCLLVRERTPAAVYRAWDKNGNLLYVGSSYHPDRRMQAHQKAVWYDEMTKHRFDWYPTRDMAFAAELEAIHTEHPTYNRQGKPTDSPQPAGRERGPAGGPA